MEKPYPRCKGIYLPREELTFVMDHLSHAAMQVYLIFLMKRKIDTRHKHSGNKTSHVINNGELTFSYLEAMRYGFTRPRFARALKELHGYGLIDVTQTGQGVARVRSEYALSNRWRQFGAPEFQQKDWPQNSKYTFGFAGKKHRRKKIISNTGVP